VCGVFGVLSCADRRLRVCVNAALHSIAHRGPDGEGIWHRPVDEPPFVSFGFRRLAILDLSELAAQPMHADDSTCSIVFNGEIYNFKELRAELMGYGYRFSSSGDTEVLLAAYRHWGERCLERLNGMFAFAIWDERRHRLFVARDRFGEKPLFYFFNEERTAFVFASEMKALVASGMVPLRMHEDALRRYVRYDILDGDEQSLYVGVYRLLPGRSLTVELADGRLQQRVTRYWFPENVSPSGLGLDQAAEGLRELLTDSVRLRLRSDVPVGTSLSGGIDSSAIVCLIRQLGARGGQKTFSARMEDPALDESRFINAIKDATGLQGFEVVPRAEDLTALFPLLCRHMEEPFPATSMFAQFMVMKLARDNNVTVLLDGQGADELLGGYSHYFKLRYGDMVRRLNFREFCNEHARYREHHNGLGVLTGKGILAAFLPESAVRWRGFEYQVQHEFEQWWRDDWLFGSRSAASTGSATPYFGRFDARLMDDALNGPLQALLRYGDRNSMAWSREVRQPFLDHRVAEFVFALDASAKIGDGTSKIVLRKAMRGIVPQVILDRHDKLGFQAPLANWLGDKLSSWSEAMLEQACDELVGRLAPNIVDRFRRLTRPLDEWGMARCIFRILTLGETTRQLKTYVPAASGL
jgi:asparagine synthase (glutamine-hydrolysing)